MIFDVLRQVLGIVLALGVVSALAWVAIWLMKRLQVGASTGPGGAPADLRFVRALPLGPRERLVVVEWRGETLLLGVTAGGMSVLSREAGVAFPPGAPLGASIGTDPS